MGVGFVGLGEIGAPMARRLGARVWARRPEATAGFDDVAPSLASLAETDVIGICVSDDAAVRAVAAGFVPHLRPGTVVCLHSTVHPDTATWLAAQCDTVDAPVSGGSDGAARGELLLFVGGHPEHVARCRHVLDRLGTAHVVGGVGAGQRAKIVNNALYTANAALAATAVDVGEALGLDRAGLLGTLLGGSGGSFAAGRLDRLHDPAKAEHVAWLLAKDLDLFDEVAGEAGAAVSAVARPFLDRLRSVAHA